MAQPIWTTASGNLGSYESGSTVNIILVATPVAPATSVSYQLLSGQLPAGLILSDQGLLTGTCGAVDTTTPYSFAVRATDNQGSIRDRTFLLTVEAVAAPAFTTLPGTIISVWDSTWLELPVEYTNAANVDVFIRVSAGALPPGIEINSQGLLRGYALPPQLATSYNAISTIINQVEQNIITCLSTTGFVSGRPIIFSGPSLGNIVPERVYFVNSVLDGTRFTISSTVNGVPVELANSTGFMSANLIAVAAGQPVVEMYQFTLELASELGVNTQDYNIVVLNQNAPAAWGGPAQASNTRIPTIFNTRPDTYDITQDIEYFGYYLLPNAPGVTYPVQQPAFIGKISNDNEFSFKIIGHDFDNNQLQYSFANLPLGFSGDTTTGWINGVPLVPENTIETYTFQVAVFKANNPAIITPYFTFSLTVVNGIDGTITWITDDDLGTVENSSVSTLSVSATCDIEIAYRVTGGALPPNLVLQDNGEIIGTVAFQPTSQLLPVNTTTVFTFVVEAFSPLFPLVNSSRTFTLDVVQAYATPTDTLYIKCSPDIEDRELIRVLLNDQELIPNEYLYRPDDSNFGKATNVTYVHAYGIDAADLDAYVAAVTVNHYWNRLTLGELKTAQARDSAGNIIYEVVYSQVIDNLINPVGVSVSKQITWPRTINLNSGPWYASVDDLYTSYQNGFFTSLDPGSVTELYPNSLPNMRTQVASVLGQQFNFNLYPRWMTSQQANGSTLGFTPAWVLCYTKPGYAEIVKTNIETNWKDELDNAISLNQINFKIDRFAVDKSLTYNYDSNLVPTTWTQLPSGTPVPDPVDSQDFFVLFPRKTILPD
jgi:hypothetical protein